MCRYIPFFIFMFVSNKRIIANSVVHIVVIAEQRGEIKTKSIDEIKKRSHFYLLLKTKLYIAERLRVIVERVEISSGRQLGRISFRICLASKNRHPQRRLGKRRMQLLLLGKRRTLLLPGMRGPLGMWMLDMWLPGMRLRTPELSNRTRSYLSEQQSTRTGRRLGQLRQSRTEPLWEKIISFTYQFKTFQVKFAEQTRRKPNI